MEKNLIQPLFYGSGYTLYTTLLAALLFVGAFYGVWEYARKFDQRKFRRALFPWMLAGGALRFLDPRLIHSTLTITPGIWFVIGIPFLLLSSIDLELAEKTGWLLFAALLPFDYLFLRFSKLLYVMGALMLTVIFFAILSRIRWMDDTFAWLPHLFEAWITSFGVMAGLREEHVIAGFLMRIHPLLFGSVKTFILTVVFYLLRDLKNDEKVYAGTAIATLAVGPALRDLLELLSL